MDNKDKLEMAARILKDSPLPSDICELAIKRLGEMDEYIEVGEDWKASEIIRKSLSLSEPSSYESSFWKMVYHVLYINEDKSEWPVIPKGRVVIPKGELFSGRSVVWEENDKKFFVGRDSFSTCQAQKILEAAIELKNLKEKATAIETLRTDIKGTVIEINGDGIMDINFGCQKTTIDKVQAALEKIKSFLQPI